VGLGHRLNPYPRNRFGAANSQRLHWPAPRPASASCLADETTGQSRQQPTGRDYELFFDLLRKSMGTTLVLVTTPISGRPLDRLVKADRRRIVGGTGA